MDDLEAAEAAVVGDCIVTPAVVREIAGIVAPEDFADIRLGNLYALVVGMVSAYGVGGITHLTVFREMQRRSAEPSDASKAGRDMYPLPGRIAEIVAFGRSGQTSAHARLIREAAVSRQLARFGRRVANDADAGADAAVLAAWAVEEAKKIRDGWRAQKLAARLLRDVMDDQDDAYDWLVPGLLERGDRLVLTGQEGAGKSTLTRQIAVCLAGGMHPFTAEQIEPRTVLVVDCENSERQWRRTSRALVHAVNSLGCADPRENLHLRCMSRIDIVTSQDLGAIHGLVDDTAPDLTLIGPIYRLVPRAINNDDDASPILAALDSVRERGCALIMEAHAGHALGKGGERDLRPRGSAALMGWPEFGLGLAVSADDAKCVQVVRWRGDRDERDWPPRLRRGGVLPWTDDRREPTHEEQTSYVRGDL